MRKMTLVAGALLLLMGCASENFSFNAKTASAYLAAHQDRPDPIKNALSSGKVSRGMKEEEVLLCWGDADKVVTETHAGVQITAWRYYEMQTVQNARRRGSVLAEVLVKEVDFTNAVVSAWKDNSAAK